LGLAPRFHGLAAAESRGPPFQNMTPDGEVAAPGFWFGWHERAQMFDLRLTRR
jgi:hypothetical protein